MVVYWDMGAKLPIDMYLYKDNNSYFIVYF